MTEELRIANMTASAKGTVEEPGRNVRQKAGLNRAILDTAPAAFLAMLAYKAEEAGARIVVLNTRREAPSQTCPCCGHREKKDLKERRHDCARCGFSASRDEAAALTMLGAGLHQITGREPAWRQLPVSETPARAA